ncbi:Smr/MutS family protein [Candidatus Sumerlaeota bacterium]|nr:Smr/MutS family protein [Candidatus Sumerlaeota bacterium]
METAETSPSQLVAERLGLSRVLTSVAAQARSSLGREWVLALEVSHDTEEIERRCVRLAEVWALAEEQHRLPLGGLHDLREILERARPQGTALESEELALCAEVARLIDRAITFLGEHSDRAPRLALDRQGLHPCPDLHREVERCLTPSGDVADAASPELARLRRERRRLENGIRVEIDGMLRDTSVTALLQDAYWTERQGRIVLPLASNYRGKIPGIVHDRSATGETLFVEPMAIVELTNDATEARLAERAEIARVLGELTSLVREHIEGLRESLVTLGALDGLMAIADWGLTHDLHLTDRASASPLGLLRCHHPLLWLHQRDRSVPLDLTLTEGDRAIVISGPNAGGKTTALKTIGLIQLMVQCGLPVPADQASNVPISRHVHADIGDDQDVVAGRSTFTAHMAAIAAICGRAQPGDLVLLDELGTATDPREGGALSVAILEALSDRGCLIIATSHLMLLKQWAHETPSAQNASVGLDEQTHRPTYRLSLGLPGPSEALLVAGQVGLSPMILERAREMVPEQEQRLAELISALQTQTREVEALRSDAERLRERLSDAEKTHREAAEQIERERRAFRRELAGERKRLLAEAKAQIEQRIAHLPSKRELLNAKAEIEAEIRAADAEMAEAAQAPTEGGGEFEIGDTVEILDAREIGRIIALDAGRGVARVETQHGMTVTVKCARLGPASGKGTEAPEPSVTFARRPDVSMELDLIGQRVEPALERLDKFLDEAVSHGLTRVRVIHGHGTGALRRAVREHVTGHPLVASWSSAEPAAGGHAVTVVEIAG